MSAKEEAEKHDPAHRTYGTKVDDMLISEARVATICKLVSTAGAVVRFDFWKDPGERCRQEYHGGEKGDGVVHCAD